MKGVIKINGLLSQEEINALLKETAEAEFSNIAAPDTDKPLESLDAMEQDVLGELANISMGSAATALSALLGNKQISPHPKFQLPQQIYSRKNILMLI